MNHEHCHFQPVQTVPCYPSPGGHADTQQHYLHPTPSPVLRKILLSPGRFTTPRDICINMASSQRCPTATIADGMYFLSQIGFGVYKEVGQTKVYIKYHANNISEDCFARLNIGVTKKQYTTAYHSPTSTRISSASLDLAQKWLSEFPQWPIF